MSGAVIAGILWVLAGTVTALLPWRAQYVPGLTLMILAPLVILWLGLAHGWWLGALALAAFVSMFRRPLAYLWARARGRNPDFPQ